MSGGRDEDRALQVLVQIGTADAAPGDVDADGAGLDLRFGNVLDADVAAIEIACCSHVSLLWWLWVNETGRVPAEPLVAAGQR